MAATETTMKPPAGYRQLQVAQVTRLRQEEESWISGEELQTEGSSDDDSTHAHAPTRPHLSLPTTHATITTTASTTPSRMMLPPPPPTPSPPSSASEPANQNDPHLTETSRRLSLMGMEEGEGVGVGEGQGGARQSARTPPSPPVHTDQQVEEQEEVMLWRPKRGSLKFPHVDLGPSSSSISTSPSSSISITSKITTTSSSKISTTATSVSTTINTCSSSSSSSSSLSTTTITDTQST